MDRHFPLLLRGSYPWSRHSVLGPASENCGGIDRLSRSGRLPSSLVPAAHAHGKFTATLRHLRCDGPLRLPRDLPQHHNRGIDLVYGNRLWIYLLRSSFATGSYFHLSLNVPRLQGLFPRVAQYMATFRDVSSSSKSTDFHLGQCFSPSTGYVA